MDFRNYNPNVLINGVPVEIRYIATVNLFFLTMSG